MSPWRSRVLYFDGLYAFRQGDADRSLARNSEALKVARATDDLLDECQAITGLARLALRAGDYRRVVEITTEAHDRALAASDEVAAEGPLHLLAAGTRLLHEYAAARALYLESLDLNRRLGNTGWVSMEQQNLGWVELHLGDADAAAALFEAAEPGNDAYSGAFTDLQQAGLALVRGHRDQARLAYDAAVATIRDLGAKPDPDDQAEIDWLGSQLT